MVTRSIISKHLSIKIGLWLLLVFAMVALFGWDLLNDMRRLHSEGAIVEQSNHKSHDLHSLEINIDLYINPVKEFLITGDYRLEAHFEQLHKHLISSIARYERSYPNNKLIGVVEQLNQIRELSHNIFKLPFAVGNMEGPIILQEVNKKVGLAVAQLSEQHKELDIQVNRAMQMMNGLRVDMHDEALALVILLLMTLLLLTYFIYSQMVLPLVRMRKVVVQVGQGDFTQQCQVTSDDEIGALALAFNDMGKALNERDKKVDHARSLAAYHEKMNALGLMSAGIAHELGNPLSAISVSLQVAQKKVNANDNQAVYEHIQTAFKETQRMESIIQLILSFGRHETSHQRALFHMEELLVKAVYLAQMAPPKKAVKVSTKLSKSLPKIYADEAMVLQVLINLILNAIDACKDQGDVLLHVFEAKQGMIIEVRDTGCGIPVAVRNEIFSSHFTSKVRGEGTGLGLAISRELVHSMEGSLELISSDATGSCFQIWLPIKELL